MDDGEPIEIDRLQTQLDCLEALDDVCTPGELIAINQRFSTLEPRPTKLRDLPFIWHQKYRLIRYLGGGMSDVYLAQQINLADREVVVKIFPSNSDMDHGKLELFREESRVLVKAGQADATNVVFPIDFAVHEDTPYLVMEHVAGATFAELAATPSLKLERVVEAVTGAAQSLADTHALGIVHGDIKPSNLILKSDGSVKLIDFGLSAFFKEPTRSRFGGTLPYAAPEQLSGRKVDARTDIYCLGVVLRELVAKAKRPSRDTEVELPAGQIKQLLELADQMTAFSKDRRHESANLVVQRLKQIARSKRPLRRWLLATAVMTLFFAMAFLSCWLGWPPDDSSQLANMDSHTAFVESSAHATTQKAAETQEQPVGEAQADLIRSKPSNVDFETNTRHVVAVEPGKVIGVSPSKKYIVAKNSESDNHQIIELKAGKVIGSFEAISGSGLNWNTDETVLMVAGRSGQLTHFTILSGSGSVLRRWSTTFSEYAELSPVGDRILLRGGPLRMVDLEGRSIDSFTAPQDTFRGWNCFCGAVSSWSPDGSKFSFYDEAAQNALIYAKDGGHPLKRIKIGRNGYARFGWLPSGLEFSSLNRIYNLEGDSRLIPKTDGYYLAFSPDQTQWVASDGTICLETGRTVQIDQFYKDGSVFWDQPNVITSVDHLHPGHFREFTVQGKLIREVAP